MDVMNRETARSARHRCEAYNLGAEEYCTVKNSISWICERLKLNPTLEFTGGERGWVGDNPFIFLGYNQGAKNRVAFGAHYSPGGGENGRLARC